MSNTSHVPDSMVRSMFNLGFDRCVLHGPQCICHMHDGSPDPNAASICLEIMSLRVGPDGSDFSCYGSNTLHAITGDEEMLRNFSKESGSRYLQSPHRIGFWRLPEGLDLETRCSATGDLILGSLLRPNGKAEWETGDNEHHIDTPKGRILRNTLPSYGCRVPSRGVSFFAYCSPEGNIEFVADTFDAVKETLDTYISGKVIAHGILPWTNSGSDSSGRKIIQCEWEDAAPEWNFEPSLPVENGSQWIYNSTAWWLAAEGASNEEWREEALRRAALCTSE